MESKAKYKVGDPVIVGDLNGEYKIVIASSMREYCNKRCTIAQVKYLSDLGIFYYKIKEDHEFFNWTADMFIPATNSLKVGDRVYIREDLEEDKCYGDHCFVCDMTKYKGYITEIVDIENNSIRLDIDSMEWHWTPEMLFLCPFIAGDTVTIKENLKVDQRYGGMNFSEGMVDFKGEVATIKKVSPIGGCIAYKLDIDEGAYFWSPEMLNKNNKENESRLQEQEGTVGVRSIRQGVGVHYRGVQAAIGRLHLRNKAASYGR